MTRHEKVANCTDLKVIESKPVQSKHDTKKQKSEPTKTPLLACGDCNATYREKDHLRRHQKLKHSGYLPCPECNHACKNSAVLKLHVEAVHDKKKKKMVEEKCKDCGKVFQHKHNLLMHLKYHYRERKDDAGKRKGEKVKNEDDKKEKSRKQN